MALSRNIRAAVQVETVARASWDAYAILNFPEQQEPHRDRSRLKVIDGTRRMGKTEWAVVELIDTCLQAPRTKCLFLALTRKDAKDIVWDRLKELNDDYFLGANVNESSLTLTFLNGSTITVGGAKDRKMARRWRGRGYDLIIIDECQNFPSHLREFVDHDLKPSLLKRGAKGRLVMMGTPAEIPGIGYWEEAVAANGDGTRSWKLFQWKLDHNPNLGTAAEIDDFLAEMAESMGGADDPAFQREYRGKRVPPTNIDRPYIYDVTKQDFDARVIEEINTKKVKHTRWALPLAGDWKFVFGIDLGSRACSAIIVWGMTDLAPGTVWLVEEFLAPRMLPDTLWAKIVERRAIYNPLEMAVDEGALGVMICDGWRAPPYSLPVVAADKMAKEVQADFLSAAMSRGAVKIPKKSRMAEDMVVCRWDPDLLAKGKRRIALNPHSDVIPAGRYGFKKAHAIATSLRLPERLKTVEDKVRDELKAEREDAARKGSRSYGAQAQAALARWKR